MAVSGNGREYDISLKCSSLCKTTTSQYLVVGLSGSNTAGATVSADYTGYITDAGEALSDTQCANFAIGINQTYLSSSAKAMNVRMFGISKAKCAGSVCAGEYVMAYDGASTTTFRGHIEAVAAGSMVTASSFKTVLGRAMEKGKTNSVISIFVNPSLMLDTYIS